MNVGSGTHVSIKELAFLIKKIVNYDGQIHFNRKYPDGVKQRRLDIKRITKLGWKAKISLKNGLSEYCKYFEEKIFSNN